MINSFDVAERLCISHIVARHKTYSPTQKTVH